MASAMLFAGLTMSACAGEVVENDEPYDIELTEAELVVNSGNPGATGTFGACYYTANLTRSQYAGARMFYPCAKGSASNAPIASGVFAASTLSPGFTNSSSAIFWLGEHLASHGFIVLAMAPDNTWGNNPEWRDAHVDAYNELIEENGRTGSPILGRVDVNKIQIMGYSKGGGGALMAAQQLTSQGKVLGAVQALAPYYDSWSNVNAITAPVAIHGGSSDTVAPTGSHAVPMFNGLAATTKRVIAVYSGLQHLPWTSSSGTYHPRIKQYITSWMKVYLDGDASYQVYINGANHNASWFSRFTYVP
jgi:Dienelactone hydrolase family